MKQRNLVGSKFGRLTVVELLGKTNEKSSHHYSRVVCECGNEEIVRDTLLINGRKVQCHDCCVKNLGRHRMSNTRIFHMWMNMRRRCSNTKDKDYKDYGGRGIVVCDEWQKSFEAFYEWAVAHGYTDDLSIDRIDVNGNYEPSNCRFITMFEQASNKRSNVFVNYDGDSITISEASRRSGLNAGTIAYRLKNGWNEYDATHTELHKGFGVKVTKSSTGEFKLFDSLGKASLFIGKSSGFLSTMAIRQKCTELQIGDYNVQIAR